MGTNVKELTHIWGHALEELKNQMVQATFNKWLYDTKLVRLNGNTAVVAVRNEHAQAWLDNRLRNTIERTLGAIMKQDIDIKFVVVEPATPAANAESNGRGPGPPPSWPDEDNKEETALEKIEAKKSETERTEINPRKTQNPLDCGYVSTSHYAIRFWRPYLGAKAFDLLLILSTHEYEVHNVHNRDTGELMGWPSVAQLVHEMGIGNRATLLGREASGNRPVQRGVIQELVDHELVKYRTEGEGWQTRHIFDDLVTVRNLPLLTPAQVKKLPPSMQSYHTDWLKRMYKYIDFDAWENDERPTAVPDVGRGI